MALIEFNHLFPENQKPSDTQHQNGKGEGLYPQGVQDLYANIPFELIDLSLIKQNQITNNALYNLLLQKGLITAQEYQQMKHNVHRQLYPEDFDL